MLRYAHGRAGTAPAGAHRRGALSAAGGAGGRARTARAGAHAGRRLAGLEARRARRVRPRPMSVRFLYDTAVFLYALGSDHAYREPCRDILGLAAEGSLVGDASVELVQELVHVRARRTGDREDAAQAGRHLVPLCRLHAVEPADLTLALRLFQTCPGLHMRDAVHAATALNRDIGLILSPDRAFDAVPGIERVEPAAALPRLL